MNILVQVMFMTQEKYLDKSIVSESYMNHLSNFLKKYQQAKMTNASELKKDTNWQMTLNYD